MSMLLITHDLGVVANVADEVAVIYHGEILEAGTVDDIFRRPTHPYLKALMAAVPHFDMKPGERLKALREVPVNVKDLLGKRDFVHEPGGSEVLLSVRNLTEVVHDAEIFLVRQGQTRWRSRPSTTSASTSAAANAWGWWARAAAARPPSARS